MNFRYFLPKTISAKTAVFCAFILVGYQLLWGFSPTTISWDTYGYYLFLPQGLLHGDLGMENFETVQYALDNYVETGTFYQASQAADTGNWVVKYPMGMSVFYLPFFLLGLVVAWIGGYPIDGLSIPFQHAMSLGSITYMLIGIWLLWKILKHFFSEKITAITLLIIVFGTNYYQVHTGMHCMPHVYLFTAYAGLIWLTIRWYEARKLKYALGIGGVIGLMSISRPTEFMSILIPMLYGITSIDHLFQRVRSAFKWYKHIFAVGIVIGLIAFPQLLYWKTYAGHWLYDSYNNPGEGLDILSPNLLEFLFSYRKGWLLYTPMMGLALIGIVVGWKSKKAWWWPLTLFTLVYIYVSSCWSSWWYATSFSQRTMVQAYPLFAIGIAYVLDRTWKSIGLRTLVVLSSIGLLMFNQFQIWQYNNGIIDASRMTKRYYWKVFGRTKIPQGAEKYLLVERSVGAEDFAIDFREYYLNKEFALTAMEGAFVPVSTMRTTVPSEVLPGQVSAKLELAFADLTQKDHCWIQINGIIESGQSELKDFVTVRTMAHKDRAYKYLNQPLREFIKEREDGTYEYTSLYLTPEVRSESDPFQFYIYNQSTSDTISLRDFTVHVYERKAIYE